MNSRLRNTAQGAFYKESLHKEAGLKQLERILEADLKKLPDDQKSFNAFKHIFNRRGVIDDFLKYDSTRRGVLERKLRNVRLLKEEARRLDPNDFDAKARHAAEVRKLLNSELRLRYKPNDVFLDHQKLNKGNIRGAVAQANKIVDTKLSGRHDINANKPLESKIVQPHEERVYYSGKTSDYAPGGKNQSALRQRTMLGLLKRDAPIWVSPQPAVAVRYAHGDDGIVYAFKNTPELVEGGSIRSHRHIAKDSRKMSEAQLRAAERLDGRFFGIQGAKGIPNYERVLNYRPEVFERNLDDVYVKVKDADLNRYFYNKDASSFYSGVIDQVFPNTPIYAAKGARKEKAKDLIFNETVSQPRDVVKDTLQKEETKTALGVTALEVGGVVGLGALLGSIARKRKEERERELAEKIKAELKKGSI